MISIFFSISDIHLMNWEQPERKLIIDPGGDALNYVCHVDTDTHAASTETPPLCPGDWLLNLLGLRLPKGKRSPPASLPTAELQDWGYSGRPQGLGSFFISLIQAGGKFWGVKCFLLGRSKATSPLQITFQWSQKKYRAKEFRHAPKPAGRVPPAPQGSRLGWETVDRTAVKIQGSDPLPRCRFSQGSQSRGLTNKGDGIRGIKCLCGEQNCAKQLITEPRHTDNFVTCG